MAAILTNFKDSLMAYQLKSLFPNYKQKIKITTGASTEEIMSKD